MFPRKTALNLPPWIQAKTQRSGLTYFDPFLLIFQDHVGTNKHENLFSGKSASQI